MLSSQQIKAYFIKLLTRKKTTIFDIKKARNILFLRYDRIGDMVVTTPVFRELKLAYPEINISVGQDLSKPDGRVVAKAGLVFRIHDKVQRLINLIIVKRSTDAANEPIIDA